MKTTASPRVSRLALPDLEEARQAREAARLFAALAATSRRSQSLRLFPENKASRPVEVPAAAFRLFLDVLNQMAQGNAVTLVPTHHELTTQQAANLLRVSRPYFVKLLETGAIPHHRVGSRRRVKFAHLMHYMEQVRNESREALEQLAAQAQELNMGY
jgi:excisionase family DNA binding protein